LKFVRFIFLYGILYLSFDTIREETNLLLTLSYFECRRLWNKIMGNDEETDDGNLSLNYKINLKMNRHLSILFDKILV
jgi:hypothetical protein